MIKDIFKDRIYSKKEFLFPYNYSIRDFPFYIDVELTNYCNLDCLMCSRQKMKRKRGFILLKTLRKITEEAEKYDTGIRLVRWGEPLLHPKFSDCLSIIKSTGLMLFMSTNAILLNKNKRKVVFKKGVDTIRISFQGIDEKGYAFMRNNDKYSLVIRNLKNLIKERTENNLNKPFVILNTTITKEIKEEVKDFKEKWNKIVDKVEVGKTTFSQIEDVDRVKKIKVGKNRIIYQTL